MIVIGLDQAPAQTGWCVLSDDESVRPQWGTAQMSDYGDDDQRAMKDAVAWMVAKCEIHQPDAVFFEQIVIDYRHINTTVLHKQFSLVCAIQFGCMMNNVPAREVLISDWRKRFLGRANMPKHEGKRGAGRDWLKEAAMIEAARLGVLAATDHEAEAFGIADYGLATISTKYRLATKARADRTAVARRRKDMEQ